MLSRIVLLWTFSPFTEQWMYWLIDKLYSCWYVKHILCMSDTFSICVLCLLDKNSLGLNTENAAIDCFCSFGKASSAKDNCTRTA